MKNILVTGGAGFIGSHVVRLLVNHYPDYRIINFDGLTYAGNLENLKDIERKKNYVFLKGDINDPGQVTEIFRKFDITDVIHLAAESHVDRSIKNPLPFIQTNIIGTVNLLTAATEKWTNHPDHIFYHVSTDEVYGTLPEEGFFTEDTPYSPQSPYSASKASSDHFVRVFHNTYGLPIKISNCSNNYGPNQFPEKLIPLCINNIKNGKAIPVYGKGENIRDWLFVEDHARAIDKIFHFGKVGSSYNIGGLNEWKNIDLIHLLCDIMDKKLRRPAGTSSSLITYVKDRAGHDFRYAIDPARIIRELGWKPEVTFEVGLEKTVDWYLENELWLEHVTSGSYLDYYKQHYNI